MKKILIALLLVIITISTVSAADNNIISDNLTDSQNSNIQLSNINENNGEAISLEEGETLSHNSTGTHDPDIQLSCYQNEILKNQNLMVIYSTSNYEDITGNLSCYIDDEFLESIDLTNSYPQSLFFDVRNYDIGNHTCKLYYSGDDYYKPFNQTLPFEISNVALVFKEIMYDYENIKVEMPEDATGTVSININGTKKRYNVDYIPGYDTKSIIYELDNLKYGTYNLEITYSGNYGNITKKANFTKDYSFYLYDHGNLTKYVNETDFLFFIGVTNKITVFIDGVNINYDPNDDLEATRYTNPPNYYDGMLFDCAPIWLNRISMSKGYHTLEVKYSGDKTRPAKTIREVFYLNKPQLAKFNDIFVNSNYPINFIFSANTTGNITAYTSTDGKNYKFFAHADIANNNAKINIPYTKTGKQYVKVIYNTNNGNGNAVTSFNVIPAKVEFYKWIGVDPYNKETFTLKSGKKVTGTFSIYANKKLYKSVKITKQTTKITLPNIFDKPGKNTITAVWKTNYGSGKKSMKITVDHFVILKTVKIQKSAKKLTLQATLKKGNTQLKNKQVTFKFNGKTYKAKTNSKGIAKVIIKSNVLKKLKAGKKVTYQATYLKDTVKKTVKVQK